MYKIKSLDPKIDYCYIGSTQNFTKRKCKHKSMSNLINSISNRKLYNTIRENGGWLNFQMIPIEEYKCDTPQQAHIREQYWIENIEESKLNSIKAFATMEQRIEQKKEYYFKNRDQIAEQKKEYYFKNRDQRVEHQKEYNFKNRDQIAEQKKEYRAINKGQIAEYYKEYYKANKEKILEQKKEYNFKNREQIAEQQKEYNIKNRDKAQHYYIWKKISKEFLSILLDE